MSALLLSTEKYFFVDLSLVAPGGPDMNVRARAGRSSPSPEQRQAGLVFLKGRGRAVIAPLVFVFVTSSFCRCMLPPPGPTLLALMDTGSTAGGSGSRVGQKQGVCCS